MDSDNRRIDLAPGMIIADRFELLRPLGKGTMGSLWVAHHQTLDVDLALKFIDPDLLHRPDLRSRFAQEATAAARIRSHHVVSVLDFGEAEGSQPYIAMELLQGVSLAQRLEQDLRLSIADTARVLIHACKGLAKAHSHGIVHRDLKPENLFLTEDDEEDGFVLKILDFGVAKASSPTSGMLHRTITGQLVGTPLYMSPEQAVGHPSTPRSDLYSLASVAYRCLTGHPVFDVANIALLLVNLATREPAPLREHLPDAPEELEKWFVKALHKDPEERFASARELAEAFVGACQQGGAIVLRGVSLPPHPGDQRSHDSWDEDQPPPAPRFSMPADQEPAPPQAPSAEPADALSNMNDTLVDPDVANERNERSTPPVHSPASSRVRIIEANLDSNDAKALGFAPTMKDQSGMLREMVHQASRAQEDSSPPAVPRSPKEKAPAIDATVQPQTSDTVFWVLGALLAVGVAVAVGWFIGRTL
jgi:serine/threonine-protein kinase